MPTESEQIAALTRMLKQAQAKNDKLKEQLEKKNKQVADLKNGTRSSPTSQSLPACFTDLIPNCCRSSATT